jgi:Tol biopolymer transport system component
MIVDPSSGELHDVALLREGWLNPSLSPNGELLVYSAPSEAGYDVMRVQLDGAEHTTQPLSEAHATPATRPIWTADSHALAFHTTNDGGGIWLWTDASAATRVSPDAASDFQFYDFSPDGTWLLFQVESEIWIVPTDAPSEPRRFGDGNASPGVWSPDGRHVHFTDLSAASDETSGRISDVNPSGGAGPAAIVPDLVFTCPQAWTTEDRLVHRNCGSDPVPVYVTTVVEGADASAVSTRILLDASFESIAVSPTGSCIANWSTKQLQLRALAGEGPPFVVRENSLGSIRNVRWSPDGTTLLWIEHLQGVYLTRIRDCEGSPPQLLHEDENVERVEFLPL